MARIQNNFRVRKNFGKLKKIIEVPNLIDIQKRSYDKLLQADVPPDERDQVGLQAVFSSVFPIKDFGETSSLEFVSYALDRPKYDVDECRARGMTFAAPIKVVVRLVVWDVDDDTNTQSIRDVKEQEVYFGEIPLMTEHGTFIINGTERVVVSQLHRSPGVFFDHDRGKTHASGKKLFSARVIPYRGSWLDFEFDHKDFVYVRIDRRRKLHATVLLRALGYSTQELLDMYYDKETIHLTEGGSFAREIDYDLIAGQRSTQEIRDPETNEVLVKKGKKLNKILIKRMRNAGLSQIPVEGDELVGKVAAEDVFDEETGEVLLNCNEEITEDVLNSLKDAGISSFRILFIDDFNVGSFLRDTLIADKLTSSEDAIMEIYRRLRPGDPPTLETARNLFESLFFRADRYDLSTVGRLKLNHKFGIDEDLETKVLTKRDIIETVRYLIELRNGRGKIDDIDHLGNRRVRAVGELMENQYRIGLVRMERAIKERMSMSQEMDALMPADLINAKPVSAVVKEYFASSQLSQFMDQTNPLSEVTHKRRLSALGPGGLTRERAGFEVRDVHPTHYGRICPIETPEGPNIGLIASLSTYARINEFGFIETPYRSVEGGQATTEVAYYSALQEQGHYIAQANAPMDDDSRYTGETVQCRHNEEFEMVSPAEVTLMDVSPNQLVSVAASLVPFLEHDDANRALMGSNMQRQAVPCLRTDAPLVGTGMETHVARDSGSTVVAQRDGIVEQVDGARIVVKPVSSREEDRSILGAKPDIYNLVKFRRSNQNTALNQKPIVNVGDRVKSGDVIADGAATERGELALGQNLLVAFMPWQGYNFEDSILVSERLIREDVYTTIHIEEFECVARDTKLGKEEITRDIPNVGEEALKNLDDAGIVRIGAEVHAGDILVGKITPKGETQLSPEEKLLRAIFGEKAGDVRDTSLRLPPGVSGIIIDARVFARKGVDKDIRAQQIEDAEREKLSQDHGDNVAIVSTGYYNRIKDVLIGKTTAAKLVDDQGAVLVESGVVLDAGAIEGVARKYWPQFSLTTAEDTELVEALGRRLEKDLDEIETIYREKLAKLTKGDELPPGVIKMVKVYVAIKRKLQVGDKMAGRHGNKGVISRILPTEDLPYLEDGTPVDIVLNPLGVPSRMNVGQILEVHLGWAARELGNQINAYMETNFSAEVLRAQLKKIYETDDANRFIDSLPDEDVIRFADKLRRGIHVATPVFDGAFETEVKGFLGKAGLPDSGQAILFDGRTGEAFEEDVTVGIMYMLKLHHLVDDKIHARSIGPYSLVTQQPLGGKAQFGGQRLGEMEVWALEAYGAAYALQELLTVKSDDVVGRMRMYESIVKGQPTMQPGVPESFNVLLKELQALCLDVELINVDDPNLRNRSSLSAAE
ncbi:DNA-directed RNA polymerase subunit beta [Pseudenhygromyxa sp. WMMC2535]|uniref:DNA-directed RNA polymerase subunit beta n=1 Tax=Pseudenhygromyxa sp. WMMC2535 TaxID=2712867 RepID=UPI0015534011|nr:DNA-directed RNA polymerase subunit beta [Pseudenhygromyxa sp. WMMC2535]NVB36828.1 DNA-directed RNA polymerase subunit beta [Pseudenhygromyxa sp. WMMC2535]